MRVLCILIRTLERLGPQKDTPNTEAIDPTNMREEIA